VETYVFPHFGNRSTFKPKYTKVKQIFLYKLNVDVESVDSKRHIREFSLSDIGYETGFNVGYDTGYDIWYEIQCNIG
jgi:hypothetical protein